MPRPAPETFDDDAAFAASLRFREIVIRITQGILPVDLSGLTQSQLDLVSQDDGVTAAWGPNALAFANHLGWLAITNPAPGPRRMAA